MKAQLVAGVLEIEATGLEAMALRHFQDAHMQFMRHPQSNAKPFWRFDAIRFKTPDVPEPTVPRN